MSAPVVKRSAPGTPWPVSEWRERSTTYVADQRWVMQPGIGLHRALRGEVDVEKVAHSVPAGSVVHLTDLLASRLGFQPWTRESPGNWRLFARQAEGAPYTRLVSASMAPNSAAGPWSSGSLELMAGGLARFLAATGHPFLDTTGRTVHRIIEGTHPRERGGTQLLRNLVLPEVCSEVMEGPWASWRRELTPAEAGARYVHSFDANAQYLGPWQSVELGLGEPVETGYGDVSFATQPSIFELDRPTPDSVGREPFPLLPPVWSRPLQRYVTGPTIRRCVEVYGHAPRVKRGWAWPTHSRYLRGAGEILRDARGLLMRESGREAEQALSAVKACYATFVGRLNAEGVYAPGSAWRRPDWGHLIRATARVNLHRRLARLSVAPFAVVVDGLVFASDEADPATFAERIGLPLGDGLGQFSMTGTWPASMVAGALVAPTGRGVMKVLSEAGRA